MVVFALLLDSIGISAQFFVGTGMAAGVGFMQGRILRKNFGWNWNWMWANIIGMTISFVFFDIGSSVWSLLPEYSLPLSIVTGSVIVGFLQFRILKSKSLKFANYWIVICILGWSLAASMVGLSNYLNQVLPRSPISVVPFLLLVLVVSSVLLGFITGKGLLMIFLRNKESA